MYIVRRRCEMSRPTLGKGGAIAFERRRLPLWGLRVATLPVVIGLLLKTAVLSFPYLSRRCLVPAHADLGLLTATEMPVSKTPFRLFYIAKYLVEPK